MTDSSPLIGGLVRIHKIVTRALSISIRKCDEYYGKKTLTPDEVAGIYMYIAALKRVTHSHHLSEDEIVFPYFRDKITAPYKHLKDDHIAMAQILKKLDDQLSEVSVKGVGQLRDVLYEFDMLWRPHIRLEEQNFTDDNLRAIGMKEQLNLLEILAEHGRKTSGPGPVTLPFLIYNLEGTDREAFIISMPWFVKKVLVPVIWRRQWKPMSSLLLS